MHIDLLQHLAFDYYLPLMTGEVKVNEFATAPLWIRFVSVLVLIFICWFIQKFIQDTIVAKLYSRFISYRISKNTNKI